MSTRPLRFAGLVPALMLLAACAETSTPPQVAAAPPPAPVVPPVVGALGSPDVPVTAPLAGSSVAPPAVAPAPVLPRRLTAAETRAMLSNNTVAGLTNTGAAYAIHFAADGRERFRTGDITDTGTWRVEPDGRLCLALQRISGGTEECYLLSKYGEVTLFQRPDGVIEGSVRVLPGDHVGA